MDYYEWPFYIVGVLVAGYFAIGILWEFLLSPLLKSISFISLAIYARCVNGQSNHVKWILIPKMIWHYYKMFLFSSGEITTMSNDVCVWDGIFKWHIRRNPK